MDTEGKGGRRSALLPFQDRKFLLCVDRATSTGGLVRMNVPEDALPGSLSRMRRDPCGFRLAALPRPEWRRGVTRAWPARGDRPGPQCRLEGENAARKLL